MKPSPSVLLVYPNPRIPWVFEELGAMGARATVVHAPGVALPAGLPSVVDAVALDIYGDPDGSASELARRHAAAPFDAVFPVHEPGVPFSARLAARLGLRGISEAAAVAARDKAVMRAAFAAGGLNVPRFARAERAADPALRELRFPVVVKPTAGYSSQGVIRADDAAALRAAIDDVVAINRESLDRYAPGAGERHAGVLVEEYVDGPEFIAEAFCQAGEVYVLTLGEKGNPTGPYFEELRYIAPAQLDPAVAARCVDETARGIRALGIADGPCHVEFRLHDGVPYLLEIGARLGGSGLSSWVVQASTGRSLVRLALQNLLGGADVAGLTPAPYPVAFAANYLVPVGGSGVIARIDGLDAVRRLPQTRAILEFLGPGDVIAPYPRFSGYPAFVVSQHADYADVLAYHELLDRTIRVVYR